MLFPKKVTDNRKKNTKRKISHEVAQEVIERDKCCIICSKNAIVEIHHVFYGRMANYWPNRNDADQLVWLCTDCHDKLHSRWRKDYRDYTIHYLKTLCTSTKHKA